MSRIEDVLHADSLAQNPLLGEPKKHLLRETSLVSRVEEFPNSKELKRLNSAETPTSMTLSDFMGWTEKKDATDDLSEVMQGPPVHRQT